MDPKDLEYKELIAKLAADWNKGLSLLQFKLERCDENSNYGCNALDFQSCKLEPFMRALSFHSGSGARTHAKVYADMIAVLEKPSPGVYNHNEVIKQLADDWCSGIDVLQLKYDIAKGDAWETDDENFGCLPDDFKSNSLNLLFSALEHYEARGYSNEKQHAMVYRDMLAVMQTLQLTGKRATCVVLDDLAELELRITAACMRDEPGPEDARFSKLNDARKAFDETLDALNYATVLRHSKHTDAAPARVETVYYNPPGNPTPTFEGTIPMSTTSLSFTTVNYVSINNGPPIDLSKLPADNIFSLIEQTEAEVKRLGEIANKPKALVKRIDDLNAGIARLVAEVDGRDE